jgi:hypothetical protein
MGTALEGRSPTIVMFKPNGQHYNDTKKKIRNKYGVTTNNNDELPCVCGGVGAGDGDGERTSPYMDGGYTASWWGSGAGG